MNTFLVVGIIIILIICISLVVILLNMSSKKSKPKSTNNTQNNISLNIANIDIPKKIEQMDEFSLKKATRVVFDSFKSLDYANKSATSLDKIEWHTWQVSLIMAMIKMDKGFFIPNNDDLFHKLINQIDDKSLKQETQKIINKFNNEIDIYKSRDELSHDIAWSSKDVSILFYYMARN